jgi:Ethanolamine utilization protein EutJ (predicted chaperonin)
LRELIAVKDVTKMKIAIIKKGIVDYTSDSRTHDTHTVRNGIEGAITEEIDNMKNDKY